MDTNKPPLAARNFPTAEEEAAVAMAEGCERGLELLDSLDLPGYHLLPATRADLLRRLGRREAAAASYREALALVSNAAERRFLERRLAEVSRPAPDGAAPSTAPPLRSCGAAEFTAF